MGFFVPGDQAQGVVLINAQPGFFVNGELT
jgi:hypothetical protein